MKKLIISSIVIIAVGITIFLGVKQRNNNPKFRLEKVVRGEIISSVTATGTVNPVTTVQVGTQVSGTIKEIYADFNSPVTKGQLIAQIDPAPFEAQVEQAKANLFSAKANKEKAEATLIDAQRTLKRNQQLFAEDLIARSDLDTAETNYETAKAALNAAEAQITQAEAALKYAETNLRYTKILSPVDGIVISRNVDVGQTVAASFQTPTLFTIAQDLTKMQVNASVDEADIGKVKVEQPVTFTVDAYPEITFNGKVEQVRNSPTTIQNVVTYDVIIEVANPELKLKPGMTANVTIIVAQKKGVLKIPNSALRFSPPKLDKKKEEKGLGVWTIKNGQLQHIPVVIGISDENFTELIRGNIREGEEVIVETLSTKAKKETPPPGPHRMF